MFMKILYEVLEHVKVKLRVKTDVIICFSVGSKHFRNVDSPPPAYIHSGPPKILTEGRLHRVKVGETLMLACDVRNLGPMVLMWKKGHRVLTAGGIVVKRDKRIELNGTNVKISGK
jgi:hypothetical protein